MIIYDQNIMYASVSSSIAGFYLNFFLHAKKTFKVETSLKNILKYLIVFLINTFLSFFIIYIFDIYYFLPFIGKIVSLPIIAILGYTLMNYWVFRAYEYDALK